MAVSLLIGHLISTLILANLISRVAPYEAIAGLTSLLGPVAGNTFPSAHATAAFAASFVMMKDTPKAVRISVFVLAILICISRLYLGVNYPTDLLVGVLIGLFGAFSAKYIVRT